MSIEDNKALCRRFLTEIAALNVNNALALMAEDVSWWVQGDWPGAGLYVGRPAVAGIFALLEDLLVGPMTFTFGAATAEADRVSLEMRSDGQLSNGRHYRNSYHYLFTIRDGLIAEGKEYLDTKHLCDMLLAPPD